MPDFSPILIIGFVQAFFSGLMVLGKKPERLSNYYLSTLLFAIAIEFGIYLLDMFEYIDYKFPLLQFIYGPLILLFVEAITAKSPVFRIKHLIHFTPFLLFTLLWLDFVPINPNSMGIYFPFSKKFVLIYLGMGIPLSLSLQIYLIISLRKILSYQKKIKSLFSYKSFKNSLNWLKLIIVILIIGYLLMFIYSIFLIFNLTLQIFNPLYINITSFIFIAYLTGFYGFKQPILFNKASNEDYVTNLNSQKQSKNSNQKLNNLETEIIKRDLGQIMRNKKLYLKGNLTVDDLAKEVGIARAILTKVLNQKLKKNFYTYVNEYRVEEAKKLLKDPLYKNFSLLTIAYEAGFNSKSTFNSFFKSYVGLTPTQFKNIKNMDIQNKF